MQYVAIKYQFFVRDDLSGVRISIYYVNKSYKVCLVGQWKQKILRRFHLSTLQDNQKFTPAERQFVASN